jgi:hypothetical protein
MAGLTDEQVDFFVAVGLAITEWSEVERALFELFCDALETDHRDLASAAFYAAIGFQGKLAMATDTLYVRLRLKATSARGRRYSSTPHDIFKKWKPLRKRLEGLSKERNRLAHYPAL